MPGERHVDAAGPAMHALQGTRWEYPALKLDVDHFVRGPQIEPKQVTRRLDRFGGDGREMGSMIDVTRLAAT